MGLDVVIYRSNGVKDIFEISENLHRNIFSEHKCISYKHLQKLKDYYKTDITFADKDIEEFIEQILDFSRLLERESIKELTVLIRELTKEDNIFKLHISGD